MDTNHRIIEPHGIRDAVNLEHHIHCLEIEAYSSVLKAFVAQSDFLTWGKEELMTELRKELNITDGEHGEILMKTNSHESIKWIREHRKLGSHAQSYIKANTSDIKANTFDIKANTFDINANTSGCSSASMRSSIIKLKAPPSAAFHPQKNISRSQASRSSIPIPSSMPPKFNGDLMAAEFAYANAEKSIEMLTYNVQLPPVGKGKVPKGKYQLKNFHASESLKLKNSSDLIRIRATDTVIHDVEKMLFSREKPVPVDIERAKWTLMEQERALLEALDKLEDVLQRDDASNQMQYCAIPNGTFGGQEMKIQANFSGHAGRAVGLEPIAKVAHEHCYLTRWRTTTCVKYAPTRAAVALLTRGGFDATVAAEAAVDMPSSSRGAQFRCCILMFSIVEISGNKVY